MATVIANVITTTASERIVADPLYEVRERLHRAAGRDLRAVVERHRHQEREDMYHHASDVSALDADRGQEPAGRQGPQHPGKIACGHLQAKGGAYTVRLDHLSNHRPPDRKIGHPHEPRHKRPAQHVP